MFKSIFLKKKYMHLDYLIDSRNKAIWTIINKNYNVSFVNWSKPIYSVYQKSKKVIFYINENNLCKDSFSHELLHVYISFKGLHIDGGLKMRIMSDNFFSQLFSYELLEHIGNCLEHVKILPLYIELGFKREKFISDFDIFKCTSSEVDYLERSYRGHNKINTSLIDPFIGRIVSIIADPNEDFDYDPYLFRLQNIDNQLFQIIKNLFNNWERVKIENKTVLDHDYPDVLNVFMEELNIWKQTNLFL